MEKTLLIKAVRTTPDLISGNSWTMKGENGELPTEGRTVRTRAEVYEECELLYNNDTWRGRRVRGGYRIKID